MSKLAPKIEALHTRIEESDVLSQDVKDELLHSPRSSELTTTQPAGESNSFSTARCWQEIQRNTTRTSYRSLS